MQNVFTFLTFKKLVTVFFLNLCKALKILNVELISTNIIKYCCTEKL